MNGDEEQPIPREDSTPSVLDQAKARGWEAGYYDFGKGEEAGVDYLNPGLIERPDGLWLLVRRSEPHPQGFRFGQNNVWAFWLNESGRTPKKGHLLQWPVADQSQHFEDARGFYHPGLNQVFVGACTFIWYLDGSWTGAHQCFGTFDGEWKCKRIDYPRVGGNPGQMQKIDDPAKFEKNWLFFLHEGRLHLLYKSKPWMVCAFGDTWDERKDYTYPEGVSWRWGDLRGGTPPVLVDGLYWTFPHSSLPWKGRYRRYYAGALAFDSKPPFKPRLITPEPLLIGSQNDVWMLRKPPCIFPCGSVYRDGKWLLSCGVNDIKAAWMEFPHKDLLPLMQEVGTGNGASIFGQSGLSEAEQKKERLRANLAKARAVMAEKRARGEVKVRLRRKKRRRVIA